MEHELKVGDKVVIRKDLKENTLYRGVYVIDEMTKYRGTTQIIETVDDTNVYQLENVGDDDGYLWSWTKEMLDWPETCKANGWGNGESKTNSKEEKPNLKSGMADFGIEKIFHSEDRDTIVFLFRDGTRIKTKRAHNDKRDDMTALVYAVIYHQLNANKSKAKEYIEKLLKEKENEIQHL